MSSYSYTSPPSSPIASFFPTGPASPNAFAGFHQNPRDAHNMYASLSSRGGAASASSCGTQSSQNSSNGGSGTLKRLMCRK